MFSSIFFCVNYFAKSLPQLVAVVWILGSMFYDITFVLNQSLFLLIYFYLVDAIERILCYYLKVDNQVLFSFVNSTSLAIIFAGTFGFAPFSQQYSTISATAYGLLLQSIEPFLMIIETIQITRFIFSSGSKLNEKIFNSDEDEDGSVFYKLVTLILTFVGYGASIFLLWQTWHNVGTNIIFTLLILIITLGSLLLLTASIYREHIVIDASMATLYISYLACLASHEYQHFGLGLPSFGRLSSQPTGLPPVLHLYSRIELFIEFVRRALSTLALQLNPFFLVAFVLRIKCLISFLDGALCTELFGAQQEGEDEGEDVFEEDTQDYHTRLASMFHRLRFLAPSRAAIVRITFVVGFTSVLVQIFTSSASYLYLLARTQWLFRVVQILAAFVFYFMALKVHEEEAEE